MGGQSRRPVVVQVVVVERNFLVRFAEGKIRLSTQFVIIGAIKSPTLRQEYIARGLLSPSVTDFF